VSTCAKPGCAGSATCVLAYDYSAGLALLEDPGSDPISPHVYALCTSCAEKLRPPQGWTLEDNRSRPPLFLTAPSRHVGTAYDAFEGSEEDKIESSEARQLFFGQSA
jgi:hypothetical protein